MKKKTKVKTAMRKSAGSPGPVRKTESPEAFRGMAEKAVGQAKETYERMSSAAAEASNLIQDSCLTAAKGAMEHNAKVVEIVRANTNAAFDYAEKLLAARSPSDFVDMASDHARKHFDAISGQTRELSALGQRVTLAIAEPLTAGAVKAFRPI